MAQSPAMMAIGDSLFNGVRSLTINQTLAEWSAPAQVARALGIPFRVPDYRRNVVIDFENWLRQFPDILGIYNQLENNIRFWDRTPRSAFQQFDNLAIASTTYADMYSRTWKTAQQTIDDLHGQVGEDLANAGADLAELFFAFNTRFILNPAGDANAKALTPLEIVADRGPARLLVSIGANNGLWRMGFESVASAGAGQPGGVVYNAQDLADLDTLIDALKALPPSVEHIYLNALTPPSTLADMMPVPAPWRIINPERVVISQPTKTASDLTTAF